MGGPETRVKVKRAAQITNRVAYSQSSVNNYKDDANVRIWLTLKSKLKVQTLDIHEQFFHCLVEEPGLQLRIYYVVVYARNEVQKKDMLWKNLMQLTWRTNFLVL